MTDTPKHTTKGNWKKAGVHEGVTLPSGAVVSIRLPNLPKLIKSGQLPNDLIEAAIEVRDASKITREMLEESWEYTRWIVPRTVVAPEITEEDVDNDVVPPEDLELIVAFAGRQTDTDAVGHHLAGLEKNADWRRFRGRLSLDEISAGA